MVELVGFSLLGRVGAGSSATVWKARDQTLGRLVAIKQLAAPNEQLRAQWRREAEILASLDHPNIVAVHGYREDEHGAYIIETWIEGAPLSALLHHGALSSAQALGVIRGALLGLAHVHHHGLVHGDIAPANILLDTQGTPRLIDFGLSTGTGTSSGSATTAYASPEAQHGQPATPASDVYATAAVLAYLLRGNPTPTPTLDGVDPALHPVLTRALAENPAHRYPDAATFLHALDTDATRRYGATWWTQAGIGTLISTIPLLLLDTTETAATTAALGSTAAAPEPTATTTIPRPEASPADSTIGVADGEPAALLPATDTIGQPASGRPPAGRRRRQLVLAAAAAAVLGTGVAVAVATSGDDAKPAALTNTPSVSSRPSTSAAAPSTTPPPPGGTFTGSYAVRFVISAISGEFYQSGGIHVGDTDTADWTVTAKTVGGTRIGTVTRKQGKPLSFTLRGSTWTYRQNSQVNCVNPTTGKPTGATTPLAVTLTLAPRGPGYAGTEQDVYQRCKGGTGGTISWRVTATPVR